MGFRENGLASRADDPSMTPPPSGHWSSACSITAGFSGWETTIVGTKPSASRRNVIAAGASAYTTHGQTTLGRLDVVVIGSSSAIERTVVLNNWERLGCEPRG